MAQERVTVVASLRDELTAPARRARTAADALTSSLNRLARSETAGPLGMLTRGVGTLGLELRKLDTPLRKASEWLGSHLARAAKVAAVGLTIAGVAASGFALKTASNFEQTRIAFDGFLGSAQAGGRLFSELQDLNLRTPFELGDITGTTRQLLGFGFAADEILPLMDALTNAAAGLGAGSEGLARLALNLGQVRAAGVVTGRELRDFATIGFPGYELVAQILGKTREEIRAMGDDVQVSADQFIGAVMAQQGVLSRFSGMAEAQMGSLMGVFSNLKDAVAVRLSDAASPLVAGLKDAVPRITELVGGLIDTLGPPLIRVVLGLADTLVGFLPTVGSVLGAVANGFAMLGAAAAPALAALRPAGAELGRAVTDFFSQLAPMMPDLVEAFVGLVLVLPSFVGILSQLLPLTRPLLELVNGLLGMEEVRGILAGTLVVLLGYRALTSVVSALYAFAGGLTAIATAQSGVAATAGAAGAGGGAGLGALGRFGLGAGGAFAAFQGVRSSQRNGPSLGSDLMQVGGLTATGAAVGSVVPGVGTAVGAGVGAGVGLISVGVNRLFGDDGGSEAHARAEANRRLSQARVAAGIGVPGVIASAPAMAGGDRPPVNVNVAGNVYGVDDLAGTVQLGIERDRRDRQERDRQEAGGG